MKYSRDGWDIKKNKSQSPKEGDPKRIKMKTPNNLLLSVVSENGGSFIFIETKPLFPDVLSFPLILSMDSSGILFWDTHKEPSIQEIIIERIVQAPQIIQAPIDLEPTEYKIPEIFQELFYKNGQIGVGREPLYNYKFDIAVSENSLSTAFHIGDGKFGFSMGNGTQDGFLPEIMGMGKTEQDAGLYLLGRAGNNIPSDIPLIIIDGRNSGDGELKNRPIFGITSADYTEYKFIIDQKGNIGIGKKAEIYKLEVNGEVSAKDLIIEGTSLANTLKELKKEIQELLDKRKIKENE
jgi:hypothetical protein